MIIEEFIEMLQIMQKEHPYVDVYVRRDTGYEVPIVTYNETNVAGHIAPDSYIQIL